MTRRHRGLAVLDAPSNLGLRPPDEGLVPGCYKAPGVLRDTGLLDRLGAADAGVVTPGRYRPAWAPGSVRNEEAIASHSYRLAGRLAALVEHSFPVVLGGDCSILVGIGLALHRAGRFGLVSLDGLDFRHPGNLTDAGVAVGGESLALVAGLGGALADLDGRRPYLRTEDIVSMGVRPEDELAADASSRGLTIITSPEVDADPAGVAARALEVVDRPELDGFWVHVDADVVDPTLMPAVDSPEPGGLGFESLVRAIRGLLTSPRAVGLDVTIYDPDLDPEFQAGHDLADALVAAFDDG